MNTEMLRTVEDWARFYRDRFHLPAQERGGYVMLPITDAVTAVHMPIVRAQRTALSLERQGTTAPLLARQTRWSFLATVDRYPHFETFEALTRNDIYIPMSGSALMIPTGLSRHTREGNYWVTPPHRDRILPALSTVVTTALAISRGTE